MTQHAQIMTPKSGKPIYYLLLARNDEIIGHIQFHDVESLNQFKKVYDLLIPHSYGLLQVDIDPGNE